MPSNITLLLLFPSMNKVNGQLVLVTSNRGHALVPLLSCSVSSVLTLKQQLTLHRYTVLISFKKLLVCILTILPEKVTDLESWIHDLKHFIYLLL